jgi:hypothetical protein
MKQAAGRAVFAVSLVLFNFLTYSSISKTFLRNVRSVVHSHYSDNLELKNQSSYRNPKKLHKYIPRKKVSCYITLTQPICIFTAAFTLCKKAVTWTVF